MIIRNVPNMPQRGLISITLDKKSFDFRSQRMESNAIFCVSERRDFALRQNADGHVFLTINFDSNYVVY